MYNVVKNAKKSLVLRFFDFDRVLQKHAEIELYKRMYERSYIWTAEKDLKTWNLSLKKIQAWTRFEPFTSAVPVQCSTTCCALSHNRMWFFYSGQSSKFLTKQIPLHLIVTFLVCLGLISGPLGLSHAKIQNKARPNSSEMPPKRSKDTAARYK